MPLLDEKIGTNALRTSHRRQEFDRLADRWRRETGHFSSLEEKILNPAYQRIIGMGEDALPLILNELEQRPGQWFWVLKAITGENPMNPEHAGNMKQMTEDWLAWAEQNGYARIKR